MHPTFDNKTKTLEKRTKQLNVYNVVLKNSHSFKRPRIESISQRLVVPLTRDERIKVLFARSSGMTHTLYAGEDIGITVGG